MSKCYDYNRAVDGIFIDFILAYDWISRFEFYKGMEALRIQLKLIRLVKVTKTKICNRVMINGYKPLSTILLNILVEKVLREVKMHTHVIIYNHKH